MLSLVISDISHYMQNSLMHGFAHAAWVITSCTLMSHNYMHVILSHTMQQLNIDACIANYMY